MPEFLPEESDDNIADEERESIRLAYYADGYPANDNPNRRHTIKREEHEVLTSYRYTTTNTEPEPVPPTESQLMPEFLPEEDNLPPITGTPQQRTQKLKRISSQQRQIIDKQHNDQVRHLLKDPMDVFASLIDPDPKRSTLRQHYLNNPTVYNLLNCNESKRNLKLELLHAALGLAGEVGELVDTIKKHVFYDQPLNVKNLLEESGDIEFYHTALRQAIGFDRSDALQYNIDKLNTRYPTGYSDEAAKERADKQPAQYTAIKETTRETLPD